MVQHLEKNIGSQENCLNVENPPNNTNQVNHNRRTLVKKIAVGSAALACCSVIPEKWSTPLVEFGTLPAHATTSGTIKDIIEKIKEETEPDEQLPETTTDSSNGYTDSEKIKRTGDIYIDGIIRSKYVSSKIGTQYGSSINIVFSNGDELYVPDTTKDVNTVEGRAYRPGGGITRHKDVHTMEVYADIHEHPAYITVYYNG